MQSPLSKLRVSQYLIYAASLASLGYSYNSLVDAPTAAFAGTCCSDGGPCSASQVCCKPKSALDCSATQPKQCTAPSSCE